MSDENVVPSDEMDEFHADVDAWFAQDMSERDNPIHFAMWKAGKARATTPEARANVMHEIVEARRAMLTRLSDVQAMDRQTGNATLYDHELSGYKARIFMAIDAEIERIDRYASSAGDQEVLS